MPAGDGVWPPFRALYAGPDFDRLVFQDLLEPSTYPRWIDLAINRKVAFAPHVGWFTCARCCSEVRWGCLPGECRHTCEHVRRRGTYSDSASSVLPAATAHLTEPSCIHFFCRTTISDPVNRTAVYPARAAPRPRASA